MNGYYIVHEGPLVSCCLWCFPKSIFGKRRWKEVGLLKTSWRQDEGKKELPSAELVEMQGVWRLKAKKYPFDISLWYKLRIFLLEFHYIITMLMVTIDCMRSTWRSRWRLTRRFRKYRWMIPSRVIGSNLDMIFSYKDGENLIFLIRYMPLDV